MDILSVISTAVQLADIGKELAKTLKTIYDEYSRQEQTKDLHSYVESTSSVLEEIGKIFSAESKKDPPVISSGAIIAAKNTLARCREYFRTLESMVDDARNSPVGFMKLSLNSSRLDVLQTKLDASKLDLQLMMSIVTYANMEISPRHNPADDAEQRELVITLLEERDLLRGKIEQLKEDKAGRNGVVIALAHKQNKSPKFPPEAKMSSKQKENYYQSSDHASATPPASTSIQNSHSKKRSGRTTKANEHTTHKSSRKNTPENEKAAMPLCSLLRACCPSSNDNESSPPPRKVKLPQPQSPSHKKGSKARHNSSPVSPAAFVKASVEETRVFNTGVVPTREPQDDNEDALIRPHHDGVLGSGVAAGIYSNQQRQRQQEPILASFTTNIDHTGASAKTTTHSTPARITKGSAKDDLYKKELEELLREWTTIHDVQYHLQWLRRKKKATGTMTENLTNFAT